MKTKVKVLEALTQNIVGLVVAFCVMTVYGLPLSHTLGLQAVLFVLSVVRSYIIRAYFSRFDGV